jgi:signal peptidase I
VNATEPGSGDRDVGAGRSDPHPQTRGDDLDRPTAAPANAPAVPTAAAYPEAHPGADPGAAADAPPAPPPIVGPERVGGGQPSDSAPGRSRRLAGAARELAILVVIAAAISVLLRAFVVQAFYIPSQSMEQTLLTNERVLVDKVTPRVTEVERGQIVVFRDPGGWLPAPVDTSSPVGRAARKFLTFVGVRPSDSGEDLIKRVIGVGGDRVACCDDRGRITVNGVPLDEPYLFPGDKPSDVTFDVAVPDDRLWVMGDHRSQSGDSREHLGDPGGGTVPVDRVVGRAFVVVWPLSSARWLRQPATFEQVASRR